MLICFRGTVVLSLAEFASPPAENRGEFASPYLNSYPFPSERNLKTRKLDPRSEPAGVSRQSPSEQKTKSPEVGVSLRNIQTAHLQDNRSLIKLYYQAVADGRIGDSEAGRLDFFARVALDATAVAPAFRRICPQGVTGQ